MTPDPRSLLAATAARPPRLYRYSKRPLLERSLEFGEFSLCAATPPGKALFNASNPIMPFGAPQSNSTLLTLSLSSSSDSQLYRRFGDADCCLVIEEPEEFGERLHRAMQRLLPHWTGIDAAISYDTPSALGPIFSRRPAEAGDQEWLFAWRTAHAGLKTPTVCVQIGNLESIARLHVRSPEL
jgi:hypothetical protein